MQHDKIGSQQNYYFVKFTDNLTHADCLKRLFLLREYIHLSLKAETEFITKIYFKTCRA